jgi:hypothetical protein
LLSEEISSQENKYIYTKDAGNKKDTPVASNKSEDLVIFVRRGLKNDYETLIAGARKNFWKLLLIKFVDISENTTLWPYYFCARVGLLVFIAAFFS